MTTSGADPLSRFVLRARRVAAHSLVQDRVKLAGQASGALNGTLDALGNMTLVQDLPENEEAFESLVARLRPLTVASEPIYYAKVFVALEAHASDEERAKIVTLWDEWKATEIQGSQVQAFSLQQSKLDGSEATDFVSDTQLAAAWLYADLVHADAVGPKKAALDFSFIERYAAAVRVFSRIASLTLATLEVIEAMVVAGRVTISAEAITDEVVIGKNQLVREARAYVAEVGTAPPDLRITQSWPLGWKHFTVTEMRRQTPENRVTVRLRGHDGRTIDVYDSAVIHRNMEIVPGEWHVLVGGCFVFKFAIDPKAGSFVDGRFDGIREIVGTNELGLAAVSLRLKMHEASAVVFNVNEVDLFELSGFELSPEQLREDEVLAEVLGDIVAIEQIKGDQYELCATRFTNQHRVLLRRTRLLHEGNLVRSGRGPIRVTIPGDGPPKVIHTSAVKLDVGGAVVPVPASMAWHPEISAELVGVKDGVSTYLMTVPEGERFLEWAPDKLDLQPDSDFSNVAAHGLIGLDEESIG